MKTVLHTYEFDVRKPDDKSAWCALKVKLAAPGMPSCHGPVLSDRDYFTKCATYDGATVTLETKHLFDNQWNIVEGNLRVFDWTLEAVDAQWLRRGHYLDQTAEMRDMRRNTHKCGYCGHQEAAQRGLVFCDQCRGSAYLKASDLYLTRMVAIDARGNLPPLTEAEQAYLLPLYREAQIYGNMRRNKARFAKARFAKARAELLAKKERVVANAITEFEGMRWLMDHGIDTDNVIYYSHTGRFGFGWRQPLDAEILKTLLEALGAEFTFSYDIKCADGRTLSGN